MFFIELFIQEKMNQIQISSVGNDEETKIHSKEIYKNKDPIEDSEIIVFSLLVIMIWIWFPREKYDQREKEIEEEIKRKKNVRQWSSVEVSERERGERGG